MVEAAGGGDWETARALHYRLLPLVRLLFVENNPAGIKTAMNLAGLPAGELRPPLGPLEPENVARMEKALADCGLPPRKKAR
jgi:4-hydroxy-tetrahydrodipicolinate synthase